jgi:hypothetical protein
LSGKAKELDEKTTQSVDGLMNNLQKTLEYFSQFVLVTEKFNSLNKKNNFEYSKFFKNAFMDVRRRLNPEDRERALKTYNEYVL